VGSRSAFIVPATSGNWTHRDPTEGWEASRGENRWRETRERTLSFTNLSTKRQRIAALARAKRGVALSTLHHVIDLEWMKEAYRLTRKDGAPGIDGVTAADYATNLEANLLDLLDRIKSGRYQAPPVRRAYIPKADGSLRPLGLPTFEDKVAQRTIVMVLEAVYEQDFLVWCLRSQAPISRHPPLPSFIPVSLFDLGSRFSAPTHTYRMPTRAGAVEDGRCAKLAAGPMVARPFLAG